jgi:two-component system sensor histidine kinase KdpD
VRYLGAAVLVAVTTAVAFVITADAAASGLMLMGAVIASALLGRGPGLFAAVAAAFSYSFFFIPPVYRLSMGKGDDLVALVVFVVAAFVIGGLVAQVNEARDARAAAELSQSRAAFFAAAGHNLRTPLASVSASVSALTEADERLDPAERRELLDAIRDETDRLTRLVSKVLELARIRGGGLEVTIAPVDLAGLCQVAVRRLGPLAGQYRFELDVPVDVEVDLDSVLTEQILLNLLENAVKFAPPGSAVGMVGRVLDGSFELRVVDRGPGIPVHEREKVFEEFYRGDRSSDSSGTGLGLAIARSLTEVQGGTLRCEETPGGGATLVLVFPLGTRQGHPAVLAP